MLRRNFLKLSAVAVSALPVQDQTRAEQPSQAKPGIDKDTLINLEKQAWAAWRNKDTGFLLSFFSESSVIIGPAGVFNRNSIKELTQIDGPIPKYVLQDFQMVRLSDNSAILTFKALQDISGESESQLSPTWASTVYVRRDNKWEAAFHQQTAVVDEGIRAD